MITKKNISSNKEGKRKAFLVMVFVVSLSVIIFSFEWGIRNYTKEVFITSMIENNLKSSSLNNNTSIQTSSLQKVVIMKNSEANNNDNNAALIENISNSSDFDETVNNEPYIIVEEMPEFPGGNEGMIQFFKNNIKNPDLARQNRVEGTVYLQFVIGIDGSVRDVSLARGIGSGCDEEAIRIAKMMPNWKPGKQGNKLVNVLCTIPINFQLNK